ncbi:MAG: glutamine--tRNA ligase/YqeY domain fusion protein [Bacteroidetes bacterium]|nr:glutamine--tRNA ligase/YqeY domain fusion protein [Bacteroidota bacterium]MDA1121906.1 glutamine--tRNA ligase/YqeY domain fusion protein [Bacteroidota bacterium]
MDEGKSLNFIEQIIEDDLESGKHSSIVTRFPPEPNGYLHLGHAKSICLNFGIAKKYGGHCNLRFDDTNPEKEDVEYVDSILEDVKWLGFEWEGAPRYASDYFEQLFELAVNLIKKGKAYVDEQSAEQISATRGTPTRPGEESPFRNRPADESLSQFLAMREGKFKTGERVLRAKIDMASPNMHMRDPILYRIKHAEHHRTGNEWCIYPNYDFAHGQSDSIEHVTHSLCTLEFEVHRPLYNWIIETLGIYPSRQIEFARLNLTYTIMSKRKLLELVQGGHVIGWDDPRMPTLSGIRRRGYTPEAVRNFADKIGIAKRDNLIDVALLEHSIREDLNKKSPRRFGILDPIKVIITNYSKDDTEMMSAVNNPEDETAGMREMPFSNEIYIEQSDFMEDPPKKFFRLGPGTEVRLKYAYIIKCEDYKKNPETGKVEEIYCSYDPQTRSGSDTSGKKVKGTLGWVSAQHAVDAEIRLYDRLFLTEDLNDIEDDFRNHLNPDSLKVLNNAKLEPSLSIAKPGDQFQFERQGYFIADNDSTSNQLVFNRTVTLRDSWGKIQQKG